LKTHFYKAINLNTRDIKKGYTYLYITIQHVLYRTNREEKQVRLQSQKCS